MVQARNAGPGSTRGIEFRARAFFSFLPGFLNTFGATVDGTWIPTSIVKLPYETAPGVYEFVTQRTPFVSDFTTTPSSFARPPGFSARVAYNDRTKFKTGADASGEL